MHAPFRLYGAELSPYSIKVRSYLRFKGLAFEWLARTQARQDEFARFAKLPLIPVLVDANDEAMQDSTPIIEALEQQFPEPSVTPDDAATAFLAALLEDYADEWLNKAMFHYRWTYPADQESAAHRIVSMMFEGEAPPEGLEESVRTRMTGRLHHVGSSAETAPVIEASFARALAEVEKLLANRPYVLGGRPSIADFGLAGQFAQLLSDPTPGAIISAQAPNVVAWLKRMEGPSVEGEFAPFPQLADELRALMQNEIAGAYLAWMAVNADAVATDAPGVSLEIDGRAFAQKPQRYAAKALDSLRQKRAAVTAGGALEQLLNETGCAAALAAGARADESEEEPEVDSGEPGSTEAET